MKNDDSGVYCIVNTVNGKQYVGSSIHINRRWQEHLSALRNGRHGNKYLQNEFDLYGEDCFCLEIVELAEGKETLFQKEQKYLISNKLYERENGYNISRNTHGGGLFGSDNPSFGVAPQDRMSKEGFKKFGDARVKSKSMLGKHHTKESREKISKGHRGIKHTEEWKKEHSKVLKGRRMSSEQKENIRNAKLTKPSKRDKAVVCVETGETFKSMGEAGRKYGVSKNAIYQCIKGVSKTCAKHHWKLAE